MKKQLFVLAALVMAASMFLAACGPAATTAAPAPATAAPVPATAAPAPATAVPPTAVPGCAKIVQLRWFIGLGTGANPPQVDLEQQVVDDFNAANPCIHLALEIIPNASAPDTLATEIAAGAAPDIVGPVGWIGSNQFYGQWLDIAPYIASTNYDTSKFEPALTKMYQSEQGTTGLPFAVYPSAIFYNPKLFTEAGLNPPPAKYGDQYKMPDGTMVDWSWDTLTKVAKMLTIDSTGKYSGEAGFNKTKVVQYGFTWQWENKPSYWGSFWGPGQFLVPGGAKGSYAAQLPDTWKAAWKWYFDGMWGAEPYVPTGAVESSADFDSGSSFASGKLGMLESPSWMTCCLADLTKAGGTFDFGIMPSYNGVVSGRVDADTFRIWKGTKNPAEAFTALAYFIDTGIVKLVVGSNGVAPAYGAVPSQISLRQPWLDANKTNFSFVTNWQTLLDGLNYPDVPSAEAYTPNINEMWARSVTFSSLLTSGPGTLDLAKAEAQFQTDMTTIFNK